MALTSEYNLLFGFLALQNAFITREELIAATSAWLQDKNQLISTILRGMSKATEEELQLVDLLLKRHCERHAGEAGGLAALAEMDLQLVRDLSRLEDGQLSQHFVQEHINVDPNATSPHDAEKVTRFQKTRFHTEGGLGRLYIAIDTELDREVAVKEVHGRYDCQASRKRLLTEATITGKLEHPGIVPVYGLGIYPDGRPYYAMKFIHGISLADAIKDFHGNDSLSPQERNYSLRKLLGKLVDVCNAIEFAHSRGVLHRDLKPENIMLGHFGETLVVDWGLAKAWAIHDEAPQQNMPVSPLHVRTDYLPDATQMGAQMGTPAYSSPEQITGDIQSVNKQSDIYCIGATLYTLLVGQPAFSMTEDERRSKNFRPLRDRVQNGEFRKPREVDRHVSQSLEAICLRAMAVSPADRYRSAQELGEAIERWLADEPIAQIYERVKFYADEVERATDKNDLTERYGRELASFSFILAALERHEESLNYAREAISTLGRVLPLNAKHKVRIEQEIIFMRQHEVRLLDRLSRQEECRHAQRNFDEQLNGLIARCEMSPELQEEVLYMSLHLGLPRQDIEARLNRKSREESPEKRPEPAFAESRHQRSMHGKLSSVRKPRGHLDYSNQDTRGNLDAETTQSDVGKTLHLPEDGPSGSSATPRVEDLHFAVGIKVKILDTLGQGGSSVVFRAREEPSSRPLAIKVAANVAGNGILEREVRLVSRLQHDHILPIYYSGVSSDGRTWYSMPELQGFETLRDLCRRLPADLPSLRSALSIFMKICDAAEYAHSRGVIHCDIKPDNIMTNGCSAYLVDWSLALLRPEVGDADGLLGEVKVNDRTSGIVGTPLYMAPEQAGLGIGTIEATTDVYLLGATLYQILSGKPPVRMNVKYPSLATILDSIRRGEAIKPVEEVNSAVPPELALICNRALQFEQGKRFATVRELRDAIDQWLWADSSRSRGRSLLHVLSLGLWR